MTRAPIFDLKARLSRYLDIVRAGEDVIVTDRGRPIARITPIAGSDVDESRLKALARTGLLRFPTRQEPIDFAQLERPADPEEDARRLILEERAEGP